MSLPLVVHWLPVRVVQATSVALVVRTLPLLFVWVGSRLVRAASAVVAPVPPWARDRAVVRFVKLVMSLLAPEPAARRLLRAAVAVVAPVPPRVKGTVPRVMTGVVVPVATVMGPPLVAVTLVTVPVVPAAAVPS